MYERKDNEQSIKQKVFTMFYHSLIVILSINYKDNCCIRFFKKVNVERLKVSKSIGNFLTGLTLINIPH